MKAFLQSRLKKAYYSVLERLPFHRTHSSSTPSKTTNVCASILSPFETYVVSLQSLLIWERPYLSAASFVILNCLFWLIVSWNRRFFSIVALAVLFVYVYRVWVYQVWPEIRVPLPEGEENEEEWTPVHPQVLSVPELSHHISNMWAHMVNLYNESMKIREKSHGLFCFLGCTACLLLAFLGHMVPGVILVYSLVLGVLLGPGIILHLIPASIYDQLVGFLVEDSERSRTAARSGDADSDLDEFLPETSAAVLRQLSLTSDSAEITESKVSPGLSVCEEKDEEEEDQQMTAVRELGLENLTCDSEESSLYTGLGAFPSVEEENESDIEDEDIGLPKEYDLKKTEQESSEKMKFIPTYFKEESSESDSDAAFTEGLSFGPVVEETKEQQQPSGSEILSKDGQGKETKVLPISVDSDEELADFEILEEADLS